MVEQIPHSARYRKVVAVCCVPLAFLGYLFILPVFANAQPKPLQEPSPLSGQLEGHRAIVLNLEDSLETRISQATAMLAIPSRQAVDIAVNLLSTGNEPSTKIVLCRAIQRVAQNPSASLDPRLVDPLLALLNHPSNEVTESASRALSWFQDAKVFDSLSQIASRQDASKSKRLAALSALTRNTDRRDVVGKLIRLLDTTDPDFRPLVLDALAGLDSNHGGSVDSWKRWWTQQEQLSESQWLRQQLLLKSLRLAARDRELHEARESANEQRTQLSNRLNVALSAQYRLTSADQKDALLMNWLEDPTADTRLVAAGLVAEQISEGNLPTDDLRNALRKRYSDVSPAVRKTSVEIVGALNDPDDAEPMLARLANETDPSVRETILSMLGKLRNPDAIGPLINEITRADSPDGCVAAASEALGMLATRDVLSADHVRASIEPLRSRFATANGTSDRMKIALLGAMAAIASPEFRPEFEANLSATDPELLLRAIQGVAVVGHDGQLGRLKVLAAHTDARVRQRAVAALGALGTIEELKTVVTRLDPSVEKVEGPRQQAWLAFVAIGSKLSMSDRVLMSDMLNDHPNHLAEFLVALEADLQKVEPPHPELTNIQERLAKTYVGLGRNVEALPYWRKVYNDPNGRNAIEKNNIALQYFKSSLSCDKTDNMVELLTVLSAGPADTLETVQRDTIQYLDALTAADRLDDLQSLYQMLRSTPLDAYPLLRNHLDSATVPNTSTNG